MMKFNSWGWIICHEEAGSHWNTMRFDTKEGALYWIEQDPVNRWVDSECLIMGDKNG